MNTAKVGVIGTSRKVDERRYPIHPAHLPRIPEALRQQLIFEAGYGKPFGVSDDEIRALTGGIATRHALLADIGTVIIAKPVLADLQELKEGGTLWGYVHCVQQRAITQAALD
jgi:alanine dehydrogenase